MQSNGSASGSIFVSDLLISSDENVHLPGRKISRQRHHHPYRHGVPTDNTYAVSGRMVVGIFETELL